MKRKMDMFQANDSLLSTPKTPDFIKSLFNEDSGLGMDFEDQNSPTFFHSFNRETNIKRKMNDLSGTPISYTKRKCIKINKTRELKKSLSFDLQALGSKEIQYTHLKSEDVSVTGSVLTGDGSQECCLPTVQGRFHDLRYITPSTMAGILNGNFDDVIESYRIVDSRYSYEFEGGHIKGAENIHNKDDILEFLKNPVRKSDGKRNIIIFHCEFSLERGPKMCRFLRNKDREMNADNYPALCFPEIYILKDGYKAFYESNNELCTPMNYVPMLSKDHKEDLRHFRSKSKSWYAGQKRFMSGSKLFC